MNASSESGECASLISSAFVTACLVAMVFNGFFPRYFRRCFRCAGEPAIGLVGSAGQDSPGELGRQRPPNMKILGDRCEGDSRGAGTRRGPRAGPSQAWKSSTIKRLEQFRQNFGSGSVSDNATNQEF